MDTISDISRASQIISSYPTKILQPRESIDLDDLFGFNDIWLKSDSVDKTVDAPYVPHRIFINHVDSFNGKYLSQFLSQQTFGIKAEEGEEGEEEENLEDVVEKAKQSVAESNTKESIQSSLSSAEKKLEKIEGEELEKEDQIKTEEKKVSDDPELNQLEDFSLKYKDNIFYELFDFSQLTVQDYYELAAIDSETERKIYLKQKLKMAEPPGHLKQNVYDEEDELSDSKELKQKMKLPAVNFEVIGTCKHSESIAPEKIIIIQNTENKSMFLNQLMKCGAVIYDITRSKEQIEEATWALNEILSSLSEKEMENPEEFKQSNDTRFFILISSLMSWALTKPMDPDDPDVPFMEEDYRRRKAHPNYKLHIALEREVLAAGKKYKKQFKTAVIACGVPYGFEEDILHYLFKMGWLNAEKLPVFGRGKNLIPLIHIEDLAAIIYGIIIDFPPIKNRYIFAKEPTTSSLKDIVKAVSAGLTSGKTEKVLKEDVFLLEDEVSILLPKGYYNDEMENLLNVEADEQDPVIITTTGSRRTNNLTDLMSYQFLRQRMQQDVYDIMTTNLNMETSFVDDMNIEWKDEMGFVESANKFIKEYKEARNLTPLRIFLHGPIGSRRHMIAKRLCDHYKLKQLTVSSVIEDYIKSLKNKIQKIKDKEQEEILKEETEDKVNISELDAEREEEAEEEEVEEEEQDEETIEELEEKLKDIEENMDFNFDKLDDEHVIKIFKECLLSKPCQNQGFVLDGYPQTKSQAKALFEVEVDEEEIEEEQEDEEQAFNKSIMPDYIFSFDATDKDLLETALSSGREGKQYKESEVIQRLSLFRKLSDSEENVLDYFHELEILPIQINIEADVTPMKDKIFEEIIYKIGMPKNYDQFKTETLEEKKLREQTEQEQKLETQRKEEEDKYRLNISRREEMEKWASMVDVLKAEEEKMLAVKSMTVRNYLVREIFPTLTSGLIEVAKVKPEDPVDYLAEYLFKTNPSGRMFQPEYTEEGAELALTVKKIIRNLNIDSKVHLV